MTLVLPMPREKVYKEHAQTSRAKERCFAEIEAKVPGLITVMRQLESTSVFSLSLSLAHSFASLTMRISAYTHVARVCQRTTTNGAFTSLAPLRRGKSTLCARSYKPPYDLIR